MQALPNVKGHIYPFVCYPWPLVFNWSSKYYCRPSMAYLLDLVTLVHIQDPLAIQNAHFDWRQRCMAGPQLQQEVTVTSLVWST